MRREEGGKTEVTLAACDSERVGKREEVYEKTK